MIYIFDNFELNTELVTLSKNKVHLEIEPKLFSLMIFLCQNPNRAISREELINTVWQNRFVSEAAINRAIGQLRKHIELDTSSPKYIKTVSKVGYKLSADVRQKSQAESLGKDNKTPAFLQYVKRQSRVNITFLSVFCIFALGFSLLTFNRAASFASVEITNPSPITISSDITFNPHFDAENSELLFLSKTNSQSSPQIKALNLQQQTLAVSKDNYYYTDVIAYDKDRVIASRLTNLDERQCEIVTINKKTHSANKIIDCEKSTINSLVFDKTANTLYYRFRELVSHPYAIYAISLSSFRIQQLSRPISTGNGLGHTVFDLSANKQQLAMIEYLSGDKDELQILDLTTQKIIQRQPVPKNIHSLQWRSPMSLLMADSEGMHSIDLTHSQISKILSTSEFGRFAKKGAHKIIFEKFYFQSNLVQLGLNESPTSNLTNLSGFNGNASIANLSDTVIFLSVSPQSSAIKLRQSDGQIIDSHFPERIRHLATLDWSEDDKQVVASINDNLYLLSLNTMQWRKLDTEFKTIHHVSFIDNEHVLISAEKQGDWNLWSVNLLTKNKILMTHTEGYSGQVYKDTLYYTKFSTQGLYYQDLSTANEQLLIEDIPVTEWNNWQIVKDTLFYKQGKNLHQYDLNTKQHSIFFELANKPIRACKVTNNKNNLICEQQYSDGNLWQAEIRDIQSIR
jgi:transcriptional activator of cad operon